MVAYLVYFRGIGWIGRDLGLIGLLRRWAIAWTLPIFDLQTLYNDQIFDVAAIQDLTDLGWGWGLVVMCGGLWIRSEEHTSELQSLTNLVCRLLLEKKKKKRRNKN